MNTFVHFFHSFDCHSKNYCLSSCQIKSMTKLLQSVIRCRLHLPFFFSFFFFLVVGGWGGCGEKWVLKS